MKLVSFEAHGVQSWGVWAEAGIADLGADWPDRFPTLKSALADLDKALSRISVAKRIPRESVKLLPPITHPGRILCVGLNYKSHIAETGRDVPQYPMLFPRYVDSLVGPDEPLTRPLASPKFDFEGELAFVIGRRGRHIAVEAALDHVAGYACFNDGSIRDYQRHTTQFLPGKNFWRSGSFGPWLVTPDEVGEVGTLTLVTRLNGQEMQRAKLDDLLFSVSDLIVYLSKIMPLEPGDVIATGTTSGVGVFRDPPVFMKPGDVVEVEIDQLGVLANTIEDERPE